MFSIGCQKSIEVALIVSLKFQVQVYPRRLQMVTSWTPDFYENDNVMFVL
jgi:hypothetical protein